MAQTDTKNNKVLSTRDAVVMLLRTASDDLSGEDISARLHISRAAINTAVKALREEGYEITSATRRGYRLLSSPDVLSAGEIAASLLSAGRCTEAGVLQLMKRVKVVDTVDSTNRALMQMAEEGAVNGQILIANRQTAGRGRLGRAFSSPGGMGIYFSYLVRPEKGAGNASSFTALTSQTAVAVSLAVESVTGVCPDIKWVNDLYLGEGDARRKICGILTQMDLEPESASVRHIVIGIGVNVHEEAQDFPAEIRDIAGSLFSTTGRRIRRAGLAAELIVQMDRVRQCTDADADSFFSHYRAHSLLTGKDVEVITGEVRRAGHAVRIEEDYGLRVRFEDGTEEVLHGGEVSIRVR